MKELLTYIVQNLVEKPDEVSVTEREANGETVFEVRVADGDMGKVIGRQGRIAKEIRTVVRSYAQRTGVKVSVDIVDRTAKTFPRSSRERFLFLPSPADSAILGG